MIVHFDDIGGIVEYRCFFLYISFHNDIEKSAQIRPDTCM